MATKVKSYEELRAERQQEWEAKQALRATLLGDLHAMLAQMPDVRDAPSPDLPWSHKNICCRKCGAKEFYVTRYVTVNGLRHRAELKCLACEELATWDWTLMAWMD